MADETCVRAGVGMENIYKIDSLPEQEGCRCRRGAVEEVSVTAAKPLAALHDLSCTGLPVEDVRDGSAGSCGQ